MPLSGILPLFLVGLLGGMHCVGMCGGVVGALSLGGRSSLPIHLAYSAGRIASYALAGGLAGALGDASAILADQLPVRGVLFLLANLMFVALGLYLTGVASVLGPIERVGARLWRRIVPLTGRFLPVRTVGQALLLGALWGWLPCGLVYSALVSALTSGSALNGAGTMLAFGLGTLPNLLLAGLFATQMRRFAALPAVRIAAGLIVLSYGLWGTVLAIRLIVAI